ncbi:MAG: FHA domain-containing protein [Planctomycetaceae bacterium]
MLGQLIPCGGGDSIPLLSPKLLVGRRSSCDIKLDFPNVSSHHCELELRKGYWHIRDLNSSNGVKVNGERCETHVLMPGDEISIAKHSFRVEYVVAADSEAPEEENTFSRSLMEKAGLEVQRPNRNRMPEAAGEKKTPPVQKQSRRVASEDDFIMDWLAED